MDVKTYNPKKVIIALGSHVVSGYADDSFITIESSGDGTTMKVGCDGSVNRSVSPNRHTALNLHFSRILLQVLTSIRDTPWIRRMEMDISLLSSKTSWEKSSFPQM